MKQEINTSFIMSESDLQRKQQEKKKLFDQDFYIIEATLVYFNGKKN